MSNKKYEFIKQTLFVSHEKSPNIWKCLPNVLNINMKYNVAMTYIYMCFSAILKKT